MAKLYYNKTKVEASSKFKTTKKRNKTIKFGFIISLIINIILIGFIIYEQTGA